MLAAWPGRGRCRASCQVMHDANVTHIRRRSFAHPHGLRARRTGCGCGPWPEPGGLPGPPASVAGGGPGGRWRCNAIAGSLQRIGAAPDTGRACRTGRHDRGERCWRPAALSSAQRRLANQQRSCLWAGLSAVRPATVFSGAGSLLAAVFWQSFCVLGVVCRRTVRKPGSAKAVKGKRDTRKKGGAPKRNTLLVSSRVRPFLADAACSVRGRGFEPFGVLTRWLHPVTSPFGDFIFPWPAALFPRLRRLLASIWYLVFGIWYFYLVSIAAVSKQLPA